jgi:hypothetical protein
MKKLYFLLMIILFLISCEGSGRNLLVDEERIRENMIGDALPYTQCTNFNFSNVTIIN